MIDGTNAGMCVANQIFAGRSKVFIRSPKSVTAIEMAFQKHKNHLATRVIAVWKGKKQRRLYLRILAQRKIAAHWRGYKQRKIYQALRPAAIAAQAWARCAAVFVAVALWS